jgi:outer membrane protein TolC
VERSELGIRRARSAYYPTIYGTARYQLNDRDIPFGQDNDAWLVGATLRWELFDGNRRVHDAERARAEKRTAEEYQAELRQEIRLQVAESYLRQEETEKRLEVSRRAALDAAEGVRLLTKRYENSVSLMVELLDAQTVLNRARAQVAEMEAECARASVQALYASGTLLKEVLQ